MGISLLSVRPRVCELAVLGFVECVGREKREGIYQAVSISQVQTRHGCGLTEAQLDLKL